MAAMTWGVMWALQKGHHYFVKPFADAGRILTLPVAYGYRKITGKPWPGFFASPFANDVMMVGATAAAAFAYFNRYNPLRVPENVLINHSSTAWWSVTLGAPALAAYFLHKRGDVARMFNNTAKVVMARLPSRERVGALAQSDSLRTTFKNHPMLVASAAAGAAIVVAGVAYGMAPLWPTAWFLVYMMAARGAVNLISDVNGRARDTATSLAATLPVVGYPPAPGPSARAVAGAGAGAENSRGPQA
ncbi:MAG: hypothetical protein EBQ89_00290 [Alphaproteobacteria bacterium]|nr:hypothetical protein [Alphaproteobacteria bacterium]